jgi:hypothetical protein
MLLIHVQDRNEYIVPSVAVITLTGSGAFDFWGRAREMGSAVQGTM